MSSSIMTSKLTASVLRSVILMISSVIARSSGFVFTTIASAFSTHGVGADVPRTVGVAVGELVGDRERDPTGDVVGDLVGAPVDESLGGVVGSESGSQEGAHGSSNLIST
jgi:hypothetical protein